MLGVSPSLRQPPSPVEPKCFHSWYVATVLFCTQTGHSGVSMNRTYVYALFLTCALAVPTFAQQNPQKTYSWVASNDETVSLDPGYYHGGPTFQPTAQAPDVHVDVDAERPVRISMTSAQDWNDAAH